MRTLLTTFLFLIGIATAFSKTRNLVVAKDGSGNFTTVQAAINVVADSSADVTVIYIKNGIYKEKLVLPASKINVHFVGEDVSKTVLTYDDYASKKTAPEKISAPLDLPVFLFTAQIFLPKILRSKIRLVPLGRQ